MAAFDVRPDLRDIERPGGALDLVVRDSAKPGRSGETWVAHAGEDWTARRLEASREEVAPALLAEVSDLAQGRLPRPAHVDVHRWRYGRVVRPMGAPYLALADGAVLIGGDWALGSRAEHAWLSGQAMAEAVLG
jgi:predicted NAD/FAD-dependent oxidoreductase